MKKIIFLSLLVAFSVSVNAQRIFQKTFSSGKVKVNSDTVTNTATNYLTTLQAVPTANTVTIQWVGTSLSGTIAGTVSVLGSLDGVNFVAITGTTTGTQTGNYTATNVSKQSTSWTFSGSPYSFYRVSWTGVGTMSAVQNALLVAH